MANDLLQRLRAKYPGAYDDMDDSMLAQKLVTKYPQYQQALADVLPKTRSWGMEALPIGGAIVGGTLGAASPLPGGAVMGAGGGAALGEAAAQFLEKRQGQRQQFDAPAMLRTAAEQGAMEAVGGPIIRGVGRGLKAGASKLLEMALPRSMAEARWVQAYRAGAPLWERVTAAVTGKGGGPRTVAQTITEKGLVGTETGLGIQAKRAAEGLWKGSLAPRLRASPVKVPLPTFFDEIQQQIVKDTPELARQTDLLEALDALRESYKSVGDVSLEMLQKLKQGWAKFVPEKAYRGKPIAGSFNEVKDMAAGLARQKIYDALGPEARQAYLDYGNLLGVMEHGQTAMTGGRLRGGFGGFWSAVKDMTLTPVATLADQVVYKAGQGIELIGKPGARFVRDIIAGVPEVGRTISGNGKSGPQPSPTPAPTPRPPVTPTAIAQEQMAAMVKSGQAPSVGAMRSAAMDPSTPASERRRLLGILPPTPLPAAPSVR